MKEIKNIKMLESAIAQREGKKVQVSIGNIREIVGIISDLIYEDSKVMYMLEDNGFNRANIDLSQVT